MNRTVQEHIQEAVASIRSMIDSTPVTGLVLGSGLGVFADSLPASLAIPTRSIPHFPVSTVEGHEGQLVFADAFAQTILSFKGRLHFYESGNVDSVLFPIRVAATLGVRTLIVTNAAGGINRDFVPGDLMLITDQIDLTGEVVPAESRSLFFSKSDLFDPSLLALAQDVATKMRLQVKKGIYAGLKGPSYETAAEIAMIHRLGGDAVGMSTVLETKLARQIGRRVLGISCITNKATGTSSSKLSHGEVTEVADRVRHRFAGLLRGILEGLAETSS